MAYLDTISIIDSELMYDRLVAHIDDLVKQTQSHKEYQPLPSILRMTKRQQKMLRRYPQCKAMFGTTQKHWLTDMNVMEIVIV